MEAFKTDQALILEFIQFNKKGGKNKGTAAAKEVYQPLRRKASDPQFDNEEYLKQIEEKYMQQFE